MQLILYSAGIYMPLNFVSPSNRCLRLGFPFPEDRNRTSFINVLVGLKIIQMVDMVKNINKIYGVP
jgi:hypothetical protein